MLEGWKPRIMEKEWYLSIDTHSLQPSFPNVQCYLISQRLSSSCQMKPPSDIWKSSLRRGKIAMESRNGGVRGDHVFNISASVQFSHSVVSNSLRPHELQDSRPPCPSPTPGVHPNSCASSRWCHPAILSSFIPFSYCPQSLPASVSFPVSQLFAWGGQSIGVSASASVLPMNTWDWSQQSSKIIGFWSSLSWYIACNLIVSRKNY